MISNVIITSVRFIVRIVIFKSMKADLEAVVIDQKLSVQNKDQRLSFDVLGDNPTDHYNLWQVLLYSMS